MINSENILLNIVLILLFFKLLLIIDKCFVTNKKNKKKDDDYVTKKYEQFIDNFSFDDENMYKMDYSELKNINELSKDLKKDIKISIDNSINVNKEGLNEPKQRFPLYVNYRYNWAKLFPTKKQLKTYNNEEYYKNFSEN